MSRRDAMTWLQRRAQTRPPRRSRELGGSRASSAALYERGGFVRKVRHATVWTLTMYGRSGQRKRRSISVDWRLGSGNLNHGTRRKTNTGPEVGTDERSPKRKTRPVPGSGTDVAASGPDGGTLVRYR